MKQMMMCKKNAQKGFTLLELMVVVAIIGILAAIAIPQYSQYIIKAGRSTGKADMSYLAQLMERRFTERGFYTTARGDNTCPAISAAGLAASAVAHSPRDGAAASARYTLTLEACTDSSYRLRATPTGKQVGDGALVLDSTGLKKYFVKVDAPADVTVACTAPTCETW